MNISLHDVCLLVSLVFLFIAAFWAYLSPTYQRFNPLAIGLFFYALKDVFVK